MPKGPLIKIHTHQQRVGTLNKRPQKKYPLNFQQTKKCVVFCHLSNWYVWGAYYISTCVCFPFFLSFFFLFCRHICIRSPPPHDLPLYIYIYTSIYTYMQPPFAFREASFGRVRARSGTSCAGALTAEMSPRAPRGKQFFMGSKNSRARNPEV